MSAKEDEIRALFETHDCPLSRSDVWAVQGTPVIKHSALERLSAKLGLTWDAPREVMVSMTEIVILARATRKDGIAEWSYGEVNVQRDGMTGGNYRISGKQAGYPWAMAEKRAKDRVIIKLAGLHGAYSEDESQSFDPKNADTGTRQDNARDEDRGDDRDEAPAEQKPAARRGRPPKAREEKAAEPPREEAPPREEPRRDPDEEDADRQAARDRGEDPDEDERPADDGADGGLKARIDGCDSINKVTDLMLDPDVQGKLAALAPQIRDEVREYAKARLVSLGWPTRKVRGAA